MSRLIASLVSMLFTSSIPVSPSAMTLISSFYLVDNTRARSRMKQPTSGWTHMLPASSV